VQASMQRLADTLLRNTLRQRRDQWGGMRADARIDPDGWQSSVCAGLLCTLMSCPSDEHDLQCHHSCHERGAHPVDIMLALAAGAIFACLGVWLFTAVMYP
jgi:hypothetical protein